MSGFSSEALEAIEVTPEMMEAGVEEYALFDHGDPGEWKVAAIYRAMELTRRRANHSEDWGEQFVRQPPAHR